MYIPIVIDPFAFQMDRYTWQFYKFMDYAIKNKIPMITMERFKNDKTEFSEKFLDNHCFGIHDNWDELADVYYVPEEIWVSLVKEKGSRLATQLYLLKNRYEPLENILREIMASIELKYNENVEGVLNWAGHFESVYYLGKQHDFSVITMEFAIRFPNYYPICYFCYDGMIKTDEISKRWNRFTNEKKDITILGKKELLAIFLDDEVKDYIRLFGCKSEYELGVAGHHPICTVNYVESSYTDLELIYDSINEFDVDKILFRPHPADPYQATYRMKNIDRSKSVILFINKCSRLATQGSSIILEAFMWNRPVYAKGGVSIAEFANHSITSNEIIDDELLNYLLFGYFVPFDLIFDTEYMRWRATNPSETDLYIYHLKHILTNKNIDFEILDLPASEREKRIMESQDIF